MLTDQILQEVVLGVCFYDYLGEIQSHQAHLARRGRIQMTPSLLVGVMSVAEVDHESGVVEVAVDFSAIDEGRGMRSSAVKAASESSLCGLMVCDG